MRAAACQGCLVFFITVMIWCQGGPSFARELIMVTDVWPPFRIAAKDNGAFTSGIDIDLVKRIRNGLNLKIKVVRYPWTRCLSMMASGEADLMTGLAHTPQRAAYIQYTLEPYYRLSPAFYVQKGKGHLIRRYEDLYEKTIGYVLESAYFDRFNMDSTLLKHGVPTEIQLVKMLAAGRLDVIIGTDANLEYDIIQMGLTQKIEKTLYHPEEKIDLFVGVSRKSSFMEQIDALNQLIQTLVKTGQIQAIAGQYF